MNFKVISCLHFAMYLYTSTMLKIIAQLQSVYSKKLFKRYAQHTSLNLISSFLLFFFGAIFIAGERNKIW